jgi:GTP-binding protein
MDAAFKAHARWLTEIGTAELNRWLERALEGHSPPLVSGRRLKFRYATQVGKRPPALALFTNMADKVPDSYLRYLANDLRDRFDLQGVPIRWQLRQTRNPYAPEKSRS